MFDNDTKSHRNIGTTREGNGPSSMDIEIEHLLDTNCHKETHHATLYLQSTLQGLKNTYSPNQVSTLARLPLGELAVNTSSTDLGQQHGCAIIAISIE